MIAQLKRSTQTYWEQWFKKRAKITNPQILASNNVYILPSGFGWIYGLLLLTLFTGAINYQISTAFLMTFLLGVVGLVSAWEAHANLKDLSIQFIAIEDARQGAPAQLTLLIQTQNKTRFGLEFQLAKQPKVRLEKIPPEGIQLILPIETTQRGYFALPRIVISSLFPFGIFRVWSYAYFDQHYFVYPQPVDPGFWPQPAAHENLKKRNSAGDEEIYDLKQVETPWSQPSLIAWKIAAKGQGWFLKNRDSTEGEYWLFKLTDLHSDSIERRLQHLSYWLHEAEEQRHVYGLELNHSPTAFSRGSDHLQHCLRQLARY